MVHCLPYPTPATPPPSGRSLGIHGAIASTVLRKLDWSRPILSAFSAATAVSSCAYLAAALGLVVGRPLVYRHRGNAVLLGSFVFLQALTPAMRALGVGHACATFAYGLRMCLAA